MLEINFWIINKMGLGDNLIILIYIWSLSLAQHATQIFNSLFLRVPDISITGNELSSSLSYCLISRALNMPLVQWCCKIIFALVWISAACFSTQYFVTHRLSEVFPVTRWNHLPVLCRTPLLNNFYKDRQKHVITRMVPIRIHHKHIGTW